MIVEGNLKRSDRSITISDYASSEISFHIHYSKSDMSAAHYHRFIELMYVLNGSAEHLLNGKAAVIGANDFIIFDYGDFHSFKRIGDEPFEVVNILFTPSFFSASLADCRSFAQALSYCLELSAKSIVRQNTSGSIIHDADGSIRGYIQWLSEEYNSGAFGSPAILRSIMNIIMINSARLTPHAVFTRPSPIVRRMIEYTDEHLEEKISLEDISRHMAYCVPYLSRRFRKEMEVTYTEYLHRAKIVKSTQLLLNTDMKIGEIAERMGFYDARHYSGVFKSCTGLTPYAFRLSAGREKHAAGTEAES